MGGAVEAIVTRFTVARATKDLVTKQLISTFLPYSESSLIRITGGRYYGSSSNNF